MVNARERAGLQFESALWDEGRVAIAGVDEAGRGAWAGPVVAGAVILPPGRDAVADLLGRVDDSKRLMPAMRERLYGEIVERAVAVGVGSVPQDEIDRIGIAPATRRAMIEALSQLRQRPDFVLLDYFELPDLQTPQRGIPHGDALSLSIAAASIIAKVTRDRWMIDFDRTFAGYGFATHKGYGTAAHRAALDVMGPCALHRMSFAPIAGATVGRLAD